MRARDLEGLPQVQDAPELRDVGRHEAPSISVAATRVRVLEVRGEVDLSNSREVLGRITAQVPNDVQLVVVDLGGTTHLDSSGIAMLFQLAERLRRSRQDLRLVVPPDAPIRTVVELTAVSRVIPVDDLLAFPSAQPPSDGAAETGDGA